MDIHFVAQGMPKSSHVLSSTSVSWKMASEVLAGFASIHFFVGVDGTVGGAGVPKGAGVDAVSFSLNFCTRAASFLAVSRNNTVVKATKNILVPIIEEKTIPKIVPREVWCGLGEALALGLTSSIPVVTTLVLVRVAAIRLETLELVGLSLVSNQESRLETRMEDDSVGSVAMPISTVKSGPGGDVSDTTTDNLVALIPRRGAR